MARQTLHILGMHCASCVNHVERRLKRVDGVRDASVNLATEDATVEYDPGKVPLEKLVQAVRDAGYDVPPEAPEAPKSADGTALDVGQGLPANATETPAPPSDHGHHHHGGGDTAGESRAWRLRVLACAILAAVVLGLAMSVHTMWAAWVQLALATPVQIILGWPFYQGAWRGLRHGRADMDSLVALGTTVAFVYSVVVVAAAAVGGHGGPIYVYFDTAVVILVLIGVGRWMEARARGSAASAIRDLMHLQPAEAVVVRDGQEQTIPVSAVRVGDIVVVKPGGRLPVDAEVTQGHSTLDQSMVTGESLPVEVGPGASVYAGTVNQTGSFQARATATGGQTLLAHVVELVRQAQSSKAKVQRVVDEVAGIFVPVVLVIALGALLGWGFISGNWVFAMTTLVAVLIVACPCALGLATPTAIMVGTGIGAKLGILIKDAQALERAGRLTDVVLDKTGTLTEGKPGVTDVVSLDDQWTDADVLRLAAAVEQLSEHPLGQAIVAKAKEDGRPLPGVDDFASITGGGVRGQVEGRDVLVGRPGTLKQAGIALDETVAQRHEALQKEAKTAVVVAVDGRAVGLIALADQPRAGAKEAVASLHKLGLHTTLMTGDNRATADAIAGTLGIEDVFAEVLPTHKRDKVAALQEQQRIVAMVGDGINDAPALAQADIGIALGGGTDIAMDAGHVVLVGSDLANLARAIRLSRATMRRIYAGLFWAFIYNLVLIPVAVAGILDPMLAALAMAFSSVSVVLNALYLRWSWKG